MRIGVISDTHGLMRPEALEALRGSELIIHAGDVGRPEVLDALRRLAPVEAVRGNVDVEPWSQALPLTRGVEVGGVRLYVIHDLKELKLDPAEAGFAAVISGHTHQPSIRHHAKVLYLNPGSAGPRRFRLLASVARITIARGSLDARIIELDVQPIARS